MRIPMIADLAGEEDLELPGGDPSQRDRPGLALLKANLASKTICFLKKGIKQRSEAL